MGTRTTPSRTSNWVSSIVTMRRPSTRVWDLRIFISAPEYEDKCKRDDKDRCADIFYLFVAHDLPVVVGFGDFDLDGPFFEDVKRCFNQGINIIEDSAGFVYTILEENVVKHFYLPDDEEDICLHCENKELIMKHINKILEANVVSETDADVMLKLAHLAKVLDGVV